jgi:hypothetical protein
MTDESWAERARRALVAWESALEGDSSDAEIDAGVELADLLRQALHDPEITVTEAINRSVAADHPAIVAAMARKEAKAHGGTGGATPLSEPVVNAAAVSQITAQVVLDHMPMGHYAAYDSIVRQVITPPNINEVRAKVKDILFGLVHEGRLTLTYGRGYLKREPGGA